MPVWTANLCKCCASISSSVASINLNVSVHLALSSAENDFGWLPPVPVFFLALLSGLEILCFSTCFTCPTGGVSQNKLKHFLPFLWVSLVLSHMDFSWSKQCLTQTWIWTSTLTLINVLASQKSWVKAGWGFAKAATAPTASAVTNEWRRLLWIWVMFHHSKVIGLVKMRHAQCELNRARLERAPLTSWLCLAFLYHRSLTSDPRPTPSPSSSTKSFNPSSSVTPPFCPRVGVHVCTPAPWNWPVSAASHAALLPGEREGGSGKEGVHFSYNFYDAAVQLWKKPTKVAKQDGAISKCLF